MSIKTVTDTSTHFVSSSSSFNQQTSNSNDRYCIDSETNNYSESQESDEEIVNNEMDARLNKLKNYQDQMEIQLKYLISLSRHNYVLCQNDEVVK